MTSSQLKIHTGPKGGKYTLKNRKKTYLKLTPHLRKSATRGWKHASPHRKSERTTMLTKCGRKCFLKPDKLKFPVCAYKPRISCKPTCKGIISAKIRASQYGYGDVVRKAEAYRKKYMC
jgi:hypothetical protein